MYNYRSNRNSGDTVFFAFALGIAAGVVGTVLFAALDEDKFRHVVTRAKRVGEQADQATRDLADRTAEAVNELTGNAKDQIESVKRQAKKKLDQAHDSAEHLVDSIDV